MNNKIIKLIPINEEEPIYINVAHLVRFQKKQDGTRVQLTDRSYTVKETTEFIEGLIKH